MFQSLRYRLLLVPMVILGGTFVATSYAAYHAARTADDRILARIQAVVRTLAGPPNFVLTAPVLQQLKNLTGMEFEVGDLTTLEKSPTPTMFRKYANDPRGELVFVNEIGYQCVTVELPPSHPNYGAKVFLFYPDSLRRQEIRDAVTPVLWLGIGGGLAATILSFLMARRLVSRIRTIEAGTRSIALGEFDPLPLDPPRDELYDLAGSVNAMAAQLAANAESLKRSERFNVLGQVAGGLAHQLRNAAAGARLAVQLANEEGSNSESLDVALRQLQRMESILRQFLDLSRPVEKPTTPADLREAIAQAVALVMPRAIHQGTEVVWSPTTAVVRAIDRESFGHLLENLLLNALDAAGPGGSVEVKINADSIEVIDSGPGPSPEIATKLFEPFATAKPGGIGLGLLVAKQAAERHGMSLDWQRRDGRTVFRLDWQV